MYITGNIYIFFSFYLNLSWPMSVARSVLLTKDRSSVFFLFTTLSHYLLYNMLNYSFLHRVGNLELFDQNPTGPITLFC